MSTKLSKQLEVVILMLSEIVLKNLFLTTSILTYFLPPPHLSHSLLYKYQQTTKSSPGGIL